MHRGESFWWSPLPTGFVSPADYPGLPSGSREPAFIKAHSVVKAFQDAHQALMWFTNPGVYDTPDRERTLLDDLRTYEEARLKLGASAFHSASWWYNRIVRGLSVSHAATDFSQALGVPLDEGLKAQLGESDDPALSFAKSTEAFLPFNVADPI